MTAVTATALPGPDRISVRNDTATTECGQCGTRYRPIGRQRWCSEQCRQTAWRRRGRAPQPVLPADSDIIYQCPKCENRYLNERRCPDCNTWCRNIGPGGPCPHCDEPVTISDLINSTVPRSS